MMRNKPRYKLKLQLSTYDNGKYGESRCMSFYNTVPFDLKQLEGIILRSLEGDME